MGMGRQGQGSTQPRAPTVRRLVSEIRDHLPAGNMLDATVFRQRHALICAVLAGHLPALLAFGLWRGMGWGHSLLEILVPSICLVLAGLVRNRRLASFFSTAGLVFCSSVLVHLSDGTIEAHFHFFILIGLIALYQDWVPFLWNVTFTVLSHGIGSSIAADLMYNHHAAQTQPWTWAFVHGVSVLAACVGVLVFWRSTEREQQRNTTLTADLVAAQAESAQRQTVSAIFVNLARRNQSLLDRQLKLISELEQRERSSEGLAELFTLDHLATRIRRNAESLLVLAGESPPRRWGRPVPLAELVRAAAAEVEDYARVDVAVSDHLDVAGRAVADLAHLLAELIENATSFSSPASEVRARSHVVPDEPVRHVVSIEDTGIGMSEDEIRAANEMLASPPEVDLRAAKLGFHVVGRLAQRYGLEVRLAGTPGGGVTALVTLPSDLVTERRQPVPVAAGVALAEATASQEHLLPATDPRGGWPDPAPDPRGAEPVAAAPVPAAASPAPAWRRPAAQVAGERPVIAEATAVTPAAGEPGGASASSIGWPPPAVEVGAPGGSPGGRPDGRPLFGWPPASSSRGGPPTAAGPAGGELPPIAGPGNGEPPPGVGRAAGWSSPAAAERPAGPWPAPGSVAGAPASPPPAPAPGPSSAPGPPAPPGPPAAPGAGDRWAGAPGPGVRRVPGAGLPPAMRRRSAGDDTGATRAPAAWGGPGGGDGEGRVASGTPAGSRVVPEDRQRVRSMLSRFQASQRAGRAAARSGLLDPDDGGADT